MRNLFSAYGVPAGLLAITLVRGSLGMPAWGEAPTAAADAQPAVWTHKEKRYTYMGFTSHYSCDGLRDKIRATLLKFGARKDLEVTSTACAGGPGRPVPFPGVSIKMQVLTPASSTSATDAQLVQARWKLVDLTASRDPLDVAGDCELIEQIKEQLLPLFTTRNVQYQSTCIPNQLQIGSTQLRAEVLVADEPGKAPAGQ
jgi:hypothetical protein